MYEFLPQYAVEFKVFNSLQLFYSNQKPFNKSINLMKSRPKTNNFWYRSRPQVVCRELARGVCRALSLEDVNWVHKGKREGVED